MSLLFPKSTPHQLLSHQYTTHQLFYQSTTNHTYIINSFKLEIKSTMTLMDLIWMDRTTSMTTLRRSMGRALDVQEKH